LRQVREAFERERAGPCHESCGFGVEAI
jgi:hypothetical protein